LIGWLVELELDEGEALLTGDRLADALRDMRLLGLQPALLAPAWSMDEWKGSVTMSRGAIAATNGAPPQPGHLASRTLAPELLGEVVREAAAHLAIKEHGRRVFGDEGG
jgi:hypothetical protein